MVPVDQDLWLNSEWCDWRWRITGCEHAEVWKGFYIAHTIACFILVILGSWVIYRRVYRDLWQKKLRLFEFSNGIVKPRGTEVFLIASCVHLFGRGLYTAIVLGDGFKSQAAAEFMHEWPWETLYFACVSFTIGIIHATPKTYMNGKGTLDELSTLTKVRLPSQRTLNFLFYFFNALPPLTLPWFSIIDGYGRDTENYVLANAFNTAHYVCWSAYCWSLAAVVLYFGLKMVMILKANAVTGVKSSENGVSQTTLLKRAMIILIVTLLGITVILISFAIVLIVYAIWRRLVQGIFPLSVIVGFIWIFVTPFMIAPIYVAVGLGIIHRKPAPASSSNKSGSKGSQSQSENSTTRKSKQSLAKSGNALNA
ncbi:uncharacterized protein SPPG_07702 [Spizellomyces punctatus DAOM BR117]|uniref:Uncharacterized protein n=1 Tax=Spizellomyces punctatus (strain DAOM BR117) TaxID=645134 RepID=A0A0L0H5S7_SPIPD|nr:uncharacterized protein SPPG_07702 [Spizellomyces punctatus DAOM BR117]KNC96870.1 hypothetical protein SPPG_07702 [Spizellomyces punctatus DAOM BR117]|eukprot:XP_016604910.1 hypothetical protein SPPG_07702 [Spizellomyces punctatus DAOM BR117]